MKFGIGDALIVVDMQRDFIMGALPVPGAMEVLEQVGKFVARWHGAGLPVAFTMDNHPTDHCSFAGRGGFWPPHCVRGTLGADILVSVPAGAPVFCKGEQQNEEQYSGLTSEAEAWLHGLPAYRVVVCGLALDYCVEATALDAVRLGFEVVLIVDATTAVSEDGRARATRNLVKSGVRFRTLRWVELEQRRAQ